MFVNFLGHCVLKLEDIECVRELTSMEKCSDDTKDRQTAIRLSNGDVYYIRLSVKEACQCVEKAQTLLLEANWGR